MSRANGYRIHTFSTDGTFTMPCTGKVEVLLVGGGGGGGFGNPDENRRGFQGGGGGGGGGVILTNAYLLAGSYAVTIGAGGTAGNSTDLAANGGETRALGLVAYGGGAGARYDGRSTSFVGTPGADGASGGGATHVYENTMSGTQSDGGHAIYAEAGNLGHEGGWSTHPYGAGGGGGAGEVGHGTTGTNNSNPGKGGNGVSCEISGAEVYYGGGGAGYRKGTAAAGGLGGGGACLANGTAQAGTDGLGGGGCGGASGGSGIVIIRYKLPPVGSVMTFR